MSSTKTIIAITAKPPPNQFTMSLAYSLPVVALALLMGPVVVLPGIYAKYHGLSLTTIGTVILFARLFDAITDPLIGYYSDRYYQRTGTRKPMIAAGGVLLLVSVVGLYLPFEGVSAAYFMAFYMLFYLAATLIDIPHVAWAGALASSSQEKSRIYTVRMIATQLGVVLFYTLPMLPLFTTRDITPEVLAAVVVVGGSLLVFALVVCLNKTPDRLPPKAEQISDMSDSGRGDRSRTERISWSSFTALAKSQPLLLFLGAYLFTGLAAGTWGGLMFIFIDAYLGMGAVFSQVYLMAFIASLLATPLWYRLSLRFEKKSLWLVSTVVLLGSFYFTGQLVAGETHWLYLLLLIVIFMLANTLLGLMSTIMLSEIIDYGTWRQGQELGGTYFSVFFLMMKINTAIGASLGLLIAGGYGFEVASITHSEDSVFGLRLAMVWLPISLGAVALIFIARSPLNSRRNLIIRRRLDARTARSG